MRDSSVEMLQTYLSSIVEAIVGSVDQCPPVMRVVFKQLHKRVEEQFSEPEYEVSRAHRPKYRRPVSFTYHLLPHAYLHPCRT